MGQTEQWASSPLRLAMHSTDMQVGMQVGTHQGFPTLEDDFTRHYHLDRMRQHFRPGQVVQHNMQIDCQGREQEKFILDLPGLLDLDVRFQTTLLPSTSKAPLRGAIVSQPHTGQQKQSLIDPKYRPSCTRDGASWSALTAQTALRENAAQESVLWQQPPPPRFWAPAPVLSAPDPVVAWQLSLPIPDSRPTDIWPLGANQLPQDMSFLQPTYEAPATAASLVPHNNHRSQWNGVATVRLPPHPQTAASRPSDASSGSATGINWLSASLRWVSSAITNKRALKMVGGPCWSCKLQKKQVCGGRSRFPTRRPRALIR